ncbi:MAG: TIGR02266 family protein [Deltaproteobacteria bacterium]|nr:TIGR02266 family protein [Deltaproteobacteria bacterium]
MGEAAQPHASTDAREPTEEARFSRRSARPGESNRRLEPRFGVELDVSVSSDHNFFQGFAENMSSGGLFIATHALRPIGERLDLSVYLPGIPEPIVGVGEVRWHRTVSEASNVPPGMGVRFVHLSEGAPGLIERFLRNREPMFYEDD